jgi:hypothetical protein
LGWKLLFSRPKVCSFNSHWLVEKGVRSVAMQSTGVYWMPQGQFVELRCIPMRIATLRTHWVLVVMDQFTRRIIGFGIHSGIFDGVALCRMFQRAMRGHNLPKYLSADHDPL